MAGSEAGFDLFALHVFPSRAVTLFALNAEGKTGGVVAIGGRRKCIEVGRMTLKATGDNGTLEIGEAIAIAGAVYRAEIESNRKRESWKS